MRKKDRYSIGELMRSKAVHTFAPTELTAKEMQFTEARYRAIIDNQTELVITFTPDYRISFVNNAMCKYFCASREEMLGQNLLYSVVKEDVETVISAIRDSLRGNQSGVIVRVINAKGEVCWTEWNCKAILDGQQVLEYHVVGRDITERKKLEDALIKSEANFRKLAEASPAGIYIYRDGVICYANSALLKLTGYSYDEIVCCDPFEKLAHPDYTEMIRWNCNAMLQGEKVPPYKVRLIGKEGQDIWGYLSAEIIDYEGHTAIVGVIMDVTDSLKFEKEILKASKLESLGILVGGIAHDLNNILTVIAGNTAIAKARYNNGEDVLDLLEEIEIATGHAHTLTQQLLTFSKGGVPVKETASIAEIIRESALFVLRGSNVRCEFDIPEDLWPVDVDVGQVNQVISNLVINADQAMPEGGILKVSARNIEDQPGSRRQVCIFIEDQGVGIPEENLSKVFEPYFTTKPTGHGLGLATSYSVVKRHGGDIQVESCLGTGTRFAVYLPASLCQQAAEHKLDKIPVAGQGRILIMDDEESVRLTLGRMLNYLGYTVEYAVDGVEALECYVRALVSKEPFDAVIMDLTVPGQMGGKQAIERLLAIDPDAKVIVSSGYSNDPVIEDHTSRGFCGVITKPCNLVRLSQVLAEVLGG
ncbi:MAG: PAS domain S-box protein [Bacillota bacterium]